MWTAEHTTQESEDASWEQYEDVPYDESKHLENGRPWYLDPEEEWTWDNAEETSTDYDAYCDDLTNYAEWYPEEEYGPSWINGGYDDYDEDLTEGVYIEDQDEWSQYDDGYDATNWYM